MSFAEAAKLIGEMPMAFGRRQAIHELVRRPL